MKKHKKPRCPRIQFNNQLYFFLFKSGKDNNLNKREWELCLFLLFWFYAGCPCSVVLEIAMEKTSKISNRFLRFVTPAFFSDKLFPSHLGMNGRRAVWKYCSLVGSRSSTPDCNFFFFFLLILYFSCVIYKIGKDLVLNLIFLLPTHIHLHMKFDNVCSSENNLQLCYEICYSKNFGELLQNKGITLKLIYDWFIHMSYSDIHFS